MRSLAVACLISRLAETCQLLFLPETGLEPDSPAVGPLSVDVGSLSAAFVDSEHFKLQHQTGQ